MIIKTLEQSILFTICFFDVFDYPLTSFEVWKFLFGYRANLDKVINQLDELIRVGKIEMKNGFYFLPERSNLVDLRQKKYDISEKFWKKALLASRVISYLPFIKMVAVFNSLSYFNCRKESDIDFFIVTEKNKIWTARFLSTAVLQLLQLRRWGKHKSSRICLSYYISEESYDLSFTTKSGYEYLLAFWIGSFAPIISYNNSFQNFWTSNQWVLKFFPNMMPNITDYYINFQDPFLAQYSRKILGFIFESKKIEILLKHVQEKSIRSKQEKLGNPVAVYYNDKILKFHTDEYDQKSKKSLLYYKKELEKRLKNIDK